MGITMLMVACRTGGIISDDDVHDHAHTPCALNMHQAAVFVDDEARMAANARAYIKLDGSTVINRTRFLALAGKAHCGPHGRYLLLPVYKNYGGTGNFLHIIMRGKAKTKSQVKSKSKAKSKAKSQSENQQSPTKTGDGAASFGSPLKR